MVASGKPGTSKKAPKTAGTSSTGTATSASSPTQPVEEIQVLTLTEFTSAIEKYLGKSAMQRLWFRGCVERAHTLRPSLFRHPALATAADLIGLESKLITRVRERSIPFRTPMNQTFDALEFLFFMQHYGIPTRLLDWTENQFVALYFAIILKHPAGYDIRGPLFDSDAVVWVLDPVAWNRSVLRNFGFKEGILTPDHVLLKGYRPDEPLSVMNQDPIGLFARM